MMSSSDGEHDEFGMNRGKQSVCEFDWMHPAGEAPVVRVDENRSAEVLAVLHKVAETNSVEIPWQ